MARSWIIGTMKPPMSMGPSSSQQRQRLEPGLRPRDGFELRHCRILLASARGADIPLSSLR
jgi:hypothetical protein